LALVASLGAGVTAVGAALGEVHRETKTVRARARAGRVPAPRLRKAQLLAAPLACALALLVPGAGARAGGDPLANVAGEKAAVLLFVARDCPVSNAYAPEIKRIIARYSSQKVLFSLVYPDPDTSPAVARQHAREYGYTCPLLLDPAHRLARRAGATVTPEAAVFSPGGKLLYRGRIDDLYLGFGKRRDHAIRHDLRDALDAVLGGRPVAAPRTQAVGCFL